MLRRQSPEGSLIDVQLVILITTEGDKGEMVKSQL